MLSENVWKEELCGLRFSDDSGMMANTLHIQKSGGTLGSSYGLHYVEETLKGKHEENRWHCMNTRSKCERIIIRYSDKRTN